MTTFQWIAWQLNRHYHQTHFSTFHWTSITHSLSYRYNEKVMAKFLFKYKRNQYQISLFRASRNTPSLVMMSYPGNEMCPYMVSSSGTGKQVISKCSSAAKPTVISQPSSVHELRKMNSLLLLSFLWSVVTADIYLHNPR